MSVELEIGYAGGLIAEVCVAYRVSVNYDANRFRGYVE